MRIPSTISTTTDGTLRPLSLGRRGSAQGPRRSAMRTSEGTAASAIGALSSGTGRGSPERSEAALASAHPLGTMPDVPPFRVVSDFQPAGDQPAAIAALIARESSVATGSRPCSGSPAAARARRSPGRSSRSQRPTLVLAPNKSLAAQLAGEFREFFPDNRVEYFVSYYDYYQPEAYLPSSDTYIEKDSSINDEIDRLRHSTTASLLTRRDVIVVASVSCIYGLGSPEEYRDQILVAHGRARSTTSARCSRRLVEMQYERNDRNLVRGKFRVRGDTIEVHPAYEEYAVRIELFGDEIERMTPLRRADRRDARRARRADHLPRHPLRRRRRADAAGDRLDRGRARRAAPRAREAGKLLEAQRLRMRTEHDLEMLAELGTCYGDRELQPPPRRPRRRAAALHAARLLPRGLAARHRREPRHRPAAARPVRRRPLAEGGARRARLPAALRAMDNRPLALRGARGADQPVHLHVGDAVARTR